MLFTSHLFVFAFLPLSLLVCCVANKIFGRRGAILSVVCLSIAFYFFTSRAQVAVLVVSVFANYILMALWFVLEDPRTKKLLTIVSVAGNLAALGYYKYADFIISQIAYAAAGFVILTARYPLAGLIVALAVNCILIASWFVTKERLIRRLLAIVLIAGDLSWIACYEYSDSIASHVIIYAFGTDFTLIKIALPLGISFFTFQQIAYAIDVHAGRVKEHRFLDYAFCVTFFPHLVAGPIVNYRELIPQLKAKSIFNFRQIDLIVGISVFIIGLAKKTLLADTFATYVGPGFSVAEKAGELSMAKAWISVLSYTFQIYFDFSGYSDMAIGLARMFGVHLPVNFASPYKATSIIEFWRRWHITLSRFLRDYLYIPLGGNRKGPCRRYLNLLITMLLGGLWHGASWTFVLWGAAHGVMLALNHAWRAMARNVGLSSIVLASRGWTVFAGGITFLCLVLTWALFRAESVAGARRILGAMFMPTGIPAFNSVATDDLRFVALLCAAMIIVFALPNTQEFFSHYRVAILPEGKDLFTKPKIAWRASTSWLFLIAILGGFACFYQAEFPQFLYWGF